MLRVKNRVLAMCDGGYRDVLINKRVGSHIVEIQLHLANIHAVKKKGGHHAYKWFRRLIKEEDTYRWSTSSKGMLKRHGTFEGADGTRYSGDFATDDEGKLVFHGQGMWTGQSGDHYFGDVKFGVQHGKGTFSFANGDKYTGDFKDGGMTGRGVFVYQNGERYEGDMLEDEFHGEGKYTYEDGGTYIGKYEYGVKHGKGVSLDERGKKRFEGEYVNGEYSQGTLWEEGMRYEGAFRDGVIEGKGVMFYDNGDTHRGLWKNGRRHGYGEFFFADGKSKIVGVWKDGVNNNQQVAKIQGSAVDVFSATWEECHGSFG